MVIEAKLKLIHTLALTGINLLLNQIADPLLECKEAISGRQAHVKPYINLYYLYHQRGTLWIFMAICIEPWGDGQHKSLCSVQIRCL